MSDTIETQEEAINVKDDNLAELLAVLSTYEDAPDELTVEAWKDNYGKIFVSSVLGDDSIYVWRTINRQEYKQMVNNGIVKNPMLYEETVVRRCVLWPKVSAENVSVSDAGVVPTLAKQILYRSGFVSDQMALNLIKVI